MDWRTQYRDMLVAPEEAVRAVNSGDVVYAGMFQSTPPTLCAALMRRKDELRGVTVHNYIAPVSWALPDAPDAFRPVSLFASAADRLPLREGRGDYLPVGNFEASRLKQTLGKIDVMLVRTSPPDAHGYMSFDSAVWLSRTVAAIARLIICEVDESAIRTYGENYLHVSQVHRLCERRDGEATVAPLPPRSPEVVEQAEVICTLIATELVQDRDTVQIGLGDVTTAMALYLGDKHDLGIQTELIPGGVIDLAERGVVTGRYKELAPNTVVGSAFAQLPADELARAHMNPRFELWDFSRTDDLATLVRQSNFVAINNALQVDLTGQVTSETLNGEIFSGPGGQTTFAVAASVCRGGRSVIAVPSSSLVAGERRSRIVPVLPPGTVVTTPRTFVDYVVTEYGIATLRGKTSRQRAEELCAVAHPDFQADLRKQAILLHHL